MATAPILAAAAASSAIASIVQTGGVIASKKVLPSLAKLSPTEGMKQLLSAPRLVAVLRAALFAGAIVWVIDSALRSNAASLARAAGRPDVAAALASTIALDVAKKAAAIGLALAVLDVVVTRRSWRKALMMTPREIARERKESEGDPELKAARGRAHQTMLAAAAIGDVARARIVIVSPRHVACALRYDGPEHGGRDAAPVLLASGRGERAARIALAAHQHDVPVVYDDVVAHALVKLEIGDEIPEALYEAVAELLRESG